MKLTINDSKVRYTESHSTTMYLCVPRTVCVELVHRCYTTYPECTTGPVQVGHEEQDTNCVQTVVHTGQAGNIQEVGGSFIEAGITTVATVRGVTQVSRAFNGFVSSNSANSDALLTTSNLHNNNHISVETLRPCGSMLSKAQL